MATTLFYLSLPIKFSYTANRGLLIIQPQMVQLSFVRIFDARTATFIGSTKTKIETLDFSPAQVAQIKLQTSLNVTSVILCRLFTLD